MSKSLPLPEFCMLATEEGDLGPVLGENALDVAQEEANWNGCPVFIRDELTDEVVWVVHPTA